MKNFGITKKDLSQKLLSELVILGDLKAYLIREKQILSTPFPNNKIKSLKKIIPKKTFEKIDTIDGYQNVKLRNSFFILNPKILDFPVQGLINCLTNKASLNHKICNLDFDIKLKDIESDIKKNILKIKYPSFTSADNNNLRKSILLLNFVLNEESRPQDKLCFSQKILNKISVFRESKDILEYLAKKGKKGKKRKLKLLLDEIPQEVDAEDLVSFFSSLSLDITPLWKYLHIKKKEYLYRNFALYKDMRFENFTWAKRKLMPSFTMTMFESSKGRSINNVLPFFRKRFLRVENLSFLNPRFRVVTEKKNSILENLEVLYENFSDS